MIQFRVWVNWSISAIPNPAMIGFGKVANNDFAPVYCLMK